MSPGYLDYNGEPNEAPIQPGSYRLHHVFQKKQKLVSRLKKKNEEKISDKKKSHKAKEAIAKCWRLFLIFVQLFLSRVLYILHGILSVWRVTEVIGLWYWIIASWLGLMLFEMFVLLKRQGKEYRIQLCLLIYLMVELPSIWILELVKLNEKQHARNISSPILDEIIQKHKMSYNTSTTLSLSGFTISNDGWSLLLEQSMLVLIIIVRWLKPKGDMTREQLSAVLLLYLAVASDILDFFSVIGEDVELSTTNYSFLFTVMAFWTWSMLQFVFSARTKYNKEKSSNINEDEDEHQMTCKQKTLFYIRNVLDSEVWTIMVSMIFQDGPYAVVRIVCLFHWNIRTYTNYFFTFKNIMLLLLQTYRLISVYEKHIQKQEARKIMRQVERREVWREAMRRVNKPSTAESRASSAKSYTTTFSTERKRRKAKRKISPMHSGRYGMYLDKVISKKDIYQSRSYAKFKRM